jgi:hypothetical protein
VNFTGGTILPVREAVIVITDLYLPSGTTAHDTPAGRPSAAGLEYAARFGERERLAGGWREWLLRWLGRNELAGVSMAGIAAAALDAGTGPGANGATVRGADHTPTPWLATPVELTAGLTRLHLDRRGILRLPPGELAALAERFHRTFAGSGLTLRPLSDGNLLLMTSGIAAVGTPEPARCADGPVSVPQGPAAAPLLRLMAEIEMWLHAEPLNEARRRRGDPPVTGLWLWGAEGRAVPAALLRRTDAARPDPRPGTLAYGSDSFVSGLWRLYGGALEPMPERPAALFSTPREASMLLLAEAAAELRGAMTWTLAEAIVAIDEKLIQPALQALREGVVAGVTLVANDRRVRVGRHSALRRWRRTRAGLEAFA